MADLNNGLVLHLPMDEAEGTKLKDKSSYGNNGTITGATFSNSYNDMSTSSEEEGEFPYVLYEDDETFWTVTQTGSGSIGITFTEDTVNQKKGSSCGNIAIGAGSYNEVYIIHNFVAEDWSKYDLLSFWVYGANTGYQHQFYINDGSGNFNRYFFTDSFTGWRRIIFLLRQPSSSSGTVNFTNITQVRFDAGDGTHTGTWKIDRVTLDIGNWKFGKALYFNEITNNVLISNSSSLEYPTTSNRLSWGGWIMGVGTWSATHEMVISKTDKNYISILNGKLFVSLYINGAQVTLSSVDSINLHVWNHIFLTWDGEYIRLFVNGKLVIKSSSYAGQTLNFTSYNLYLGTYSSGLTLMFGGYLSNIRIYNRALNVEEVKLLYKENEINLRRGLVLDLPLNEGEGTKVKDLSPHGNNGVITGATWIGSDLDFDGTNDLVTLPDTSSIRVESKQVSFSVWIDVDSYPTSTYLEGIIGAESGGFAFGLYSSTGYLRATKRDVSDAPSSGLIIPLNVLTHIVITFDNNATTNNLKYYVNGKLGSVVTWNVDMTEGAASNLIGCRESGDANSFFDGTIKKLKAYNRVLSSEEVRALYLENR